MLKVITFPINFSLQLHLQNNMPLSSIVSAEKVKLVLICTTIKCDISSTIVIPIKPSIQQLLP